MSCYYAVSKRLVGGRGKLPNLQFRRNSINNKERNIIRHANMSSYCAVSKMLVRGRGKLPNL